MSNDARWNVSNLTARDCGLIDPLARCGGSVASTRGKRRGLTLVEILVATALALMLILAIAQSFATVSDTVSKGRATLEMAERMRNTVLTLTSDLDLVSVPTLPWIEPGVGAGYFEITEGWARDYDADFDNVPDWGQAGADSSFGDWDDMLAVTLISPSAPFVGYVMGTLTTTPGTIGKFTLTFDSANPRTRTKVISNAAEVIWWTTLNDVNGNGIRDVGEYFTLHRRMLLIRPDILIDTATLGTAAMPSQFFFWGNDLSVAVGAGGTRVANSLQDLSNRLVRTGHVGPLLPAALSRANLPPQKNVWMPGPDGAWGVSGVDDDQDGTTDGADIDEAGAVDSDDILICENAGQDVILPHVLAFDIRVYDPLVPLKASPNGIDLVGPGEPRYGQIATAPLGMGDFVDLGYLVTSGLGFAFPFTTPSNFGGPPRSGFTVATWDTWPTLYEMDGIDQDGDGLVDEGQDGLDNDGLKGVDNVEERETIPPYLSPLRGIKVSIRAIDPGTREIRQEHVTASFQPE